MLQRAGAMLMYDSLSGLGSITATDRWAVN